MKELSTEEKAKRYDEAINTIRNLVKAGLIYEDAAIQVFPELKELEDERIKKEISTYLKSVVANKGYGDSIIESWIAWLEKQKAIDVLDEEERKFADNVEQGEQVYDENLSKLLNKVICRFINAPSIPYSERDEVSKKIIPYVERLEKQVGKNPVWSKEDETKINYLIALLQNCTMNNNSLKVMNEEIEDWLNSLKDRIQPK